MFYSPLPRTLEAALRDITDAKVAVRVSAAKDLVSHAQGEGRARVLSAFEKALSDPHALVRSAAAEGLGAAQAKESLAALLAAVEDDHQLVRQTAILALGDIRDPRAQKRLERALTDERAEVRFQAVMAYPRVCSQKSEALAALLRATKDEDPSVAHVAFRMTEELSEPEDGAVATAASSAVVCEEVLERARAVFAQKGALKVRAVAAILLASAGDDRADDLLVEIVSNRVRAASPAEAMEPEDMASAIELAGDRNLSAARPALEKRAFGGFLGLSRDPFQWQARVALARMGDERAKRYILDELAARSFERRTLAASAAGRARLVEARARLLALRDKPDQAEPSAVEAALQLLEAFADPTPPSRSQREVP